MKVAHQRIQEQAKIIVDILTEASSASLDLAAETARTLYRHDPKSFVNNRLGVVQHVKLALEGQGIPVRLITGHVVFGTRKFPHAWLEIEGQQYDPVFALQGIGPGEYVASS